MALNQSQARDQFRMGQRLSDLLFVANGSAIDQSFRSDRLWSACARQVCARLFRSVKVHCSSSLAAVVHDHVLAGQLIIVMLMLRVFDTAGW